MLPLFLSTWSPLWLCLEVSRCQNRSKNCIIKNIEDAFNEHSLSFGPYKKLSTTLTIGLVSNDRCRHMSTHSWLARQTQPCHQIKAWTGRSGRFCPTLDKIFARVKGHFPKSSNDPLFVSLFQHDIKPDFWNLETHLVCRCTQKVYVTVYSSRQSLIHSHFGSGTRSVGFFEHPCKDSGDAWKKHETYWAIYWCFIISCDRNFKYLISCSRDLTWYTNRLWPDLNICRNCTGNYCILFLKM